MTFDPGTFVIGFSVASAISLIGRHIDRRLRHEMENARAELIAAQEAMIADQTASLARAVIVIGQFVEDDLVISIGEGLTFGGRQRLN